MSVKDDPAAYASWCCIGFTACTILAAHTGYPIAAVAFGGLAVVALVVRILMGEVEHALGDDD